MIRPLRRRHRRVTAVLFSEIVALMLMLAWARPAPSARMESLPPVLVVGR